MFGIGMPELLVIAVIALLVVGPKRLPDLARSLGKGLAEFRKATEGATETLKESLRTDEIKQDIDKLKESLNVGSGFNVAGRYPSPVAEETKASAPPPASDANKAASPASPESPQSPVTPQDANRIG